MIFISHATKDKSTIALPLYTQLKIYKLNRWIYNENIRHSDSLFEAINRGLRDSLYAVAIVSSSFMGSSWTNAVLLVEDKNYINNLKAELGIEVNP